jgi:signal peptidase
VKRLGAVASNVALLAALAFGVLMIVPAALGYQRYVILTGSMTGTYDRGSIVYDRAVPVQRLRVGDPITYSPPAGFSSHDRVTHRIFTIGHGRGGVTTYRTKGDANRVPDVWTFQLDKPTQERVAFHVPYAGYALALLSIRRYRMFLLGIPALLVALTVLRGLWREANEELQRKQRAGWGDMDAIHRPHADLGPLPEDGTQPSPVFVGLPRSVGTRGAKRRRAPRTARSQARGPRVMHLHDAQTV